MSVWNVLSTIRHDGIQYEAGQVISQIKEDEAAELEKLGVIARRDAEQVGGEVKAQVEQDAHQVIEDGESLADQVEQDIKDSLKQNEQVAAADPKQVTTGSPAPAQSSAEEIAATAAGVQ